jgi:hypothetical protein
VNRARPAPGPRPARRPRAGGLRPGFERDIRRFSRQGVKERLQADGRLKLDELITRRYALDDVNQAYADMRSGVNICGVVEFIPAG